MSRIPPVLPTPNPQRNARAKEIAAYRLRVKHNGTKAAGKVPEPLSTIPDPPIIVRPLYLGALLWTQGW